MSSVFSFFPHIYYINLSSRVDRREEVQRQLKQYDIEAKRWEAIQLTQEENLKYTLKGYPLCEKVSDTDLDHKSRIEQVTLRQRSCLFSHLSLISHAKNNNFENILIFEDDIIFNPDINIIDTISKSLQDLKNQEWDMYSFGSVLLSPTTKITDNLYRLGFFTAGHAIAFNHTIYDSILDFPFKQEMNIDMHYGRLSYDRAKSFTSKYPTIFQNHNYSDIQMREVGEIGWTIKERYSKWNK